MTKKKAAKKKVQRTDWKSECARAVDVRNYYSTKSEGLERRLEEAHKEIDDLRSRNSRLSNQKADVGNQLNDLLAIAEMMTRAPANSIPEDGSAGYGRDILLGMLLEKLQRIERPSIYDPI